MSSSSSGGASGSSGAELSVERSPSDVLLADIGRSLAYAPPVQPTPVMTPTDRGPSTLTRLETFLEGEPISCFLVGGEKRLCFPQVLNAVLRDIPYDEITRACTDLNINTPFTSPAQLETLKLTGVLPRNTASCCLITKSDAERLVNYLQAIRRPGQRLVPSEERDRDKVLGIPVRHDCFGGARGTLFPDLYGAVDAACVECTECGHVFRPEKFVVHSHHQGAERRTVHWGFDSANWRSYLRLQPDSEGASELIDKLAQTSGIRWKRDKGMQVKLRFEPGTVAARAARMAASTSALAPTPTASLADRLRLKRKAEEALDVGGKSRIPVSGLGGMGDLSAFYDPATLLAYYTSLLRYQSLLATPPPVPSKASATLSSFLATSALNPSTAASTAPPNTSLLSSSAPSKAALAAVSGLLALSGSEPSGVEPTSMVVKPQPVKATPALLSPTLPRGSGSAESPKGRSDQPLKKHLLHAFAEEQKAKEELSEAGSAQRPASSSLSASDTSEGEDGEISLDRLLEKVVTGPEALAQLRAKIAESQRNLESQIDALQKQNAAYMHQNALLQQENLALKRQEKVRGLLGSLGGNILLGH